MAFLLGFLIAFAIGVTGVGAGTVTAPLLILALGLPPEVAVGTALLFGFLVKVPAGAVYLLRRQVDARGCSWDAASSRSSRGRRASSSPSWGSPWSSRRGLGFGGA